MTQEYIISAFTENQTGVLSRITNLFTRRKVNIESLSVSESAIEGISKFTIVVNEREEQVAKIVKQLDKQVEVMKAYYYRPEEMIFQEIALYKVETAALLSGNYIEAIVRKYGARILEVTMDYTVIELTGHKHETQALFNELNEYNVLQFIRSGRVAITRSRIEKLSEFLAERKKMDQ